MVLPPNKPCLKCGEVHWSTQPCKGEKAKGERFYREPVRTSASRDVPRSVPQSSLKQAEAEIERLQGEVHALKRRLAEANAKLDAANAEIERHKISVTPPISVTPVTKISVTKSAAANKVTPSGRGRPKIGEVPLSDAERSRRARAKRHAAVKSGAVMKAL